MDFPCCFQPQPCREQLGSGSQGRGTPVTFALPLQILEVHLLAAIRVLYAHASVLKLRFEPQDPASCLGCQANSATARSGL